MSKVEKVKRQSFFARWYDRQKIAVKFMLIFAAVLLVTILATSIVMYRRASDIIGQETENTMAGLMEQAVLSTEDLYDKVEDVCFRMYTMPSLGAIFLRDSDDYSYNEQVADYYALAEIYNAQMANRFIEGICMYFSNGGYYVDLQWACFSMKDAQALPWYGEMPENGAQKWVYYDDYRKKNESERFSASCIRTVRNKQGQTVGFIEVKMNRKYLREILQNINSVINGNVYEISADGRILATTEEDMAVGSESLYTATIRELMEQDVKSAGIRDGKERQRIIMTEMTGGNYLFAVVPEHVFRARLSEFVFFAVVITLIAIIAGLLMARLLSGQISKRIVRLSGSMKKATLENTELAVIEKEDEITELSQSCNQMLTTSRRLVEDLYKVNIEKKESDLKLLQAQINPHFLYNILDSINWMAYRGETENVSKMTRLLSAFFRQALNRGEATVTVEQELEHVRTYLDILRLRYGDDIRYVIDVDPAILGQKTINLILQPIVENAVVHGIMEKEDPEGTVTIRGTHDESYMVISIIDDGVGIPEDVIERITRGELQPSSDGGFGLKNTNDRIRLHYGEEYGLMIESTKLGTTVGVRLPFCG